MGTKISSGAGTASADRPQERLVLVSYPKVVFLYPTFLVSVIAALWSFLAAGKGAADPQNTSQVVVAWCFLIALATNLVVISFDFPRTAWITLIFVIVALVLAVILLSVYYPDLLPAIGHFLRSITPTANAHFYAVISVVFVLLYIAVWISRRFDYWEVRRNELLHHHGFLSNLERFNATDMRVTKEINDVFEYWMLGAGRLVLHPRGEQVPIILENVPFISKKETALTHMLSSIQVTVATKKSDV
jgi:hypothetical protein